MPEKHAYLNEKMLPEIARGLMRQRGITQAKMAEELGLAQSVISDAVRKPTPVSRRIIEYLKQGASFDGPYWRLTVTVQKPDREAQQKAEVLGFLTQSD